MSRIRREWTWRFFPAADPGHPPSGCYPPGAPAHPSIFFPIALAVAEFRARRMFEQRVNMPSEEIQNRAISIEPSRVSASEAEE